MAARRGNDRSATGALGRRWDRYTLALTVAIVCGFGLLQLGSGVSSAGGAQVDASSSAAAKRKALAAYGKLPLAFVPNGGQIDRRTSGVRLVPTP